jgi:DNA polymerase III subunit gamma/tau
MLYRKWRPQTFDDVVGQEHVVRTLRNALRGDRVAHAYLFAGPRGTGKTTCARLLAKAVNCTGPEDRCPCNECVLCRALNEGRLMDLIEIDAASNTGVDDVRELQEKVGFQPSQARYKVYVVDEVHMLSKAAFNALLKTLEEPPPHVIFVLATTEAHRLPATIISRCQRHSFTLIPLEAIVEHIVHVADAEGMEVEPEALALIARHADGALRDALSLLEQVATGGPVTASLVRQILGVVPEEGLLDVLEAVAAGDVGQTLTALSNLLMMDTDAGVVRSQLIEYLRDALATAAGVEQPALSLSKGIGVLSRLEALSQVGIEKLLAWLSALVKTASHGTDDRTGLELALVRAIVGPQVAVTTSLDAVPVGVARNRPSVDGTPRAAHQIPATPKDPVGRASTKDRRPQEKAEEDDNVGEGDKVEATPKLPRQLDALQEHWDDVLAQVRRRGGMKLQALLRSCSPVAVGDRQVVLATGYAFHRKRLEDDDTRQVVEQALASLIGEPVEMQVVLAEREKTEPSSNNGSVKTEQEGWINSPADLPPALAQDPLVRSAMEDLGAVVRVAT